MPSVTDAAALHQATAHPVLGAMSFLNEVMDRYPDAIAMAAGAPHESFFVDVDLAGALDTYTGYLAAAGLGPADIRRVLYQYGPSRGRINEIVADALRADEGITSVPESIVITVGAQEAMFLALRVLHGSPGDAVAVVEPSYVGVIGAARVLDIPVEPIAEDAGGGPDLDILRRVCAERRARGGRVRAVYVAPDFANPGGGQMSVAARHALLDEAERLDLMILEDSAYGFTALSGNKLPTLKSLDRRRRVLHIGTFAKIGLPGARVGYVVADRKVQGPHPTTRLLADDIAAVKSMVTVNTSPVCQAIVAGMLLRHGGSLASLARAKADRYRRSLDVLKHAIRQHLAPLRGGPDDISWHEPEGGFFMRVRLPVVVDDALLERCAKSYRVIWTPMRQFYLGGGGDNELRLSCSYLDEDEITEGVARLAAFLREAVVS